MITLEVLGGVLMVFLYSQFRLGVALTLSLIGIPLVALASSFMSFSSAGRWASFVPTMVAVLLHQLHHHAVEYRRLYMQAAHVPSAAGSAEPPASSEPTLPMSADVPGKAAPGDTNATE
jgi:hypothetical protein